MAAFPESSHPPAEPADAYRERVDRGRAEATRSSVAIVGLARDLGDKVGRAAATIAEIAALFYAPRALVVENDSSDGTAAWLASWAAATPWVEVRSTTRGDVRWPSIRNGQRAAQLAGYRNECLDWVAGLECPPDYVIVLDLDLAGVSLDGLCHSLGLDPHWDAIGSNGLQPAKAGWTQYDAWAWRSIGHPHPHHHREVNTRVLRRGAHPLRVLSCFGGMAIYRREAFLAGRYGGGDCEHVIFHRKISEAGFPRIYCNPSQIVHYDPQGHA